METKARSRFYVAVDGKDTNPGTAKRPFATLERAREAIRAVKSRRGLPQGGITVLVGAGTYRRDRAFVLTGADSGTERSPIVYRAARKGTARLSGARELPASRFEAVRDEAVLARLPAGAATHVRAIDLKALKVAAPQPVMERGFGMNTRFGPSELFCGGQRMKLAQWPNEGFATTGKIIDPGPPPDMPDTRKPLDLTGRQGCFELRNSRLERWASAPDAWIYGFFRFDWADHYLPVESLDLKRRRITLKGAHRYGMLPGKRFRVLNLLEELDRPGEWYFDPGTSRLYFWPPERAGRPRMVLSTLKAPLIDVRGASHVEIAGLTLENGRGPGVRLRGGRGNRIAGCTLRGLGLDGVQIRPGGSGHSVLDCEIHDVGECGVTLGGGNRKTLSPAGHCVSGCHIHHFSRTARTYRPAVRIAGVGNRVAGNLLHHGPHSAILLGGNDHLIERNEIHHVVLDTDDAGAFYMGRNPSQQGVVVRHNFFHHIGSRLGHGTCAVYLDDGTVGVRIHGNVFYKAMGRSGKCWGAVFVHGGKDNRICNNVFVKCRSATGFATWPEKRWRDFLRGRTRFGYIDRRLHREVDIRKPPYSDRYPELSDLAGNANRNFVHRNLAVNCGAMISSRTPGSQEATENWSTRTPPGFVKPEKLDFSLRRDSAVFRKITGFEPIPFGKIGPGRRRAAGSSAAAVEAATNPTAPQADFYVAPNGEDSHPGTLKSPFATVARAQRAVRALKAKGLRKNILVLIRGGTYRIEKPLSFDVGDSGTEKHSVTWAAFPGEKPIFSGGRVITGWKKKGKLWVAEIPAAKSGKWSFRELFVNGRRATRARSPNRGYFRIAKAGPDRRTSFSFRGDDFKPWADLAGVEVVLFHDWCTTRVHPKSLDPKSRTVKLRGAVGPLPSKSWRGWGDMDHFEKHPRYFLENARAFLDAPGEWHLDAKGVVSYLPRRGERIEATEFVAPLAERLLEVQGKDGQPVLNLHFRGLAFEHCAWTPPLKFALPFSQAGHYEVRAASTVAKGRQRISAAVELRAAAGCSFRECRFGHLGGCGLELRRGAHRNVVSGCEFADIAGNGVMIGEGDLARRRGESGKYGWDLDPETVCTGNVVADNLIQRCGQLFPGSIGVWVGFTEGTRIAHNEIRDLPYTGVSVGWMWNVSPTPCARNIVERNHIHHVMQKLSDGGGIYTLGRQPGTVLRGNYIHDIPPNSGRAESNGMFLDQGSSEFLVEGNLIHAVGKSSIRFHQARNLMLRGNTLLVGPRQNPFRYNRSDPKTMKFGKNTVIQAAAGKPVARRTRKSRSGEGPGHPRIIRETAAAAGIRSPHRERLLAPPGNGKRRK